MKIITNRNHENKTTNRGKMAKRNTASPNHWSDIVGMPDEWDKTNLTNLINTFKKTPFTFENGKTLTGAQWIKAEVADAKKQHQQDDLEATKGINPYGTKIADTETRIGTAIPNVLWNKIQESYPTMFRDKKHFSWFIKNFPEFRVASKW